MNFFSHIFWTWAVFKTLKEKLKKPLNLKLAVFWGVFPDLFAFAIPIAWLIIELMFGKISISDLPGPEKIEPPQQNFNSILLLVSTLYSFSHSFVILLAVAIVWTAILYFKRKIPATSVSQILPIEMGGWILHILIDIPTHSSAFYSTPFLWPISDFKINGLSWGTPWFLALNYLVIFIVYFAYLRKKKASA
ncbi:MAG: metal-dependent hydrolase [bacterium]|nr:metal-dependent hydrolase [bacterium]